MFSYLRYFFGASIIIILVGAVLFGWYYRNTADGIITSSIEQNNIVIAKSFRNTVWNAPSPYPGAHGEAITYGQMMKLYFIDNPLKPPNPLPVPSYVDFGNRTRDLIKDIEVVQFNLYSPDGVKFFSANTLKVLPPDNYIPDTKTEEKADDKAEVKKDDSGAKKAGAGEENVDYTITGLESSKLTLQMAMASFTPKSEIIHHANYRVPLAKERMNGDLVRTFIPVKADDAPEILVDAKPELVIEVFFDVTKSSKTLGVFQYFSTGFIVIIFTLLYLILVYTSRRAEKIIEKQHETNIDLAAAKASAESENQQKSQFLGNISHELRTPLNAIIGFSEIVKDEVMGPLNNEQYKNYIKDIHSSGVYLLSLINDILDYSKAEAGKLDIEYEDIDLNKIIISSLRLQEPRAKTAEVQLLKELSQDQLLIRSDNKRLRQILLNLLSNAVKFTPAGGMVKVSAWRNLQDSQNLSIEIKDTGIGIAPKDIAKALSPFGQVDSELSRKYEGTGLGLPLTKKFIELLGGQLKLTSELGKGTTVTVILPVNNDPNSMPPKR